MNTILSNVHLWKTIGLLVLSNCFMTYAWYGHLKSLSSKPIIIAVLASWGIAFFEYLIQVPANRIGHTHDISLAQLKIMQEVISLCVFVPFSFIYMKERLSWNFLWAGLCMIGAVYFIFKD
ncbi:MAG: DMT family protein [Lentisphaeria bacterium]|nr:DMT family protein [Lentisphaeria bacterium]